MISRPFLTIFSDGGFKNGSAERSKQLSTRASMANNAIEKEAQREIYENKANECSVLGGLEAFSSSLAL